MSFNKVNQTTGELTRIAGNGDVPIDSVPTQGSTNAVQSGGVYSSIQVTKEIIAPVENGTTASKAYSIGDNFIKGDTLYKAKIAIAQGDTLTLNTNYELENDIVTQISSLKQTLESKIGEVTVKTLAANATSISFTVPTTGNNLIDFWCSDGSNYTEIDTSVSGTVTLTFEAVSSARTIYCKISEV